MKTKIALVATLIVLALGLASQQAAAHHGNVSCVEPGVWEIESWDPQLAIQSIISFDQSGPVVISGLNTNIVTVSYSGTYLSGTARWVTGNTGPFYGEGQCQTQTTTTTQATTTTVTPTSTSSTEVPETLTPSTTVSVVPSVPETSSSLVGNSTTSSEPSNTSTPTSTPPTDPSSVPPATSSPTPGTPEDPTQLSSNRQTLPATGLEKEMVIYIAGLFTLLGLVCVAASLYARRSDV